MRRLCTFLRNAPLLDTVGAVLSVACLVHCLATPLVVVMLPFVAGAGFESGLLSVLLGLATLSVLFGVLRGKRYISLFPYAGGLIAILGGRAAGFPEGSAAEVTAVLLGAVLMILTHLLNARACASTRERAALT